MAMNVGVAREGGPVSEINTTPLIDVMLVLLIMLIVTLPTQAHAVKLDTPVPCASCLSHADAPKPIRIAIDFDGSLTWNDMPTTVAELDKRLAAEGARRIKPELHIEPHRRARYEHVAHVMASAQRNGLQRLGVIAGT